MLTLFMTVVFVAMLLAPLALMVAILPAGRDCPRCGGETVPIRIRALEPVRKMLRRRWCTACGWDGMMRAEMRHRPVPATVAAAEPHEVDDDAAWRGGSGGL
jgi:hypothetical protein